MLIREALLSDIEQLHLIRNSVRENVLSDPGLIKTGDYEIFLSQRGKGWLCETGGRPVGFAIADLTGNNIWALFLLPEAEGRGIGRLLHDTMLDWYFSQTKATVWLSTATGTRAEKFYRRAGWKETGIFGKAEIRFEMSFENWRSAG